MNEALWTSPVAADAIDNDSSDKPHRELRLGAAIVAVFFIGLLGWAAATPLDAAASAQGFVAVSGNRQAVQHRDGGIVTALHVVEGQLVAKGEPLLKISASELIATERGMTGEVVALLAQRARLVAEQNGLSRVAEPAEFASFAPADRVLAAEALRGQRRLFEARRGSLQTERGVLGQRMRQHAEQINGYAHQMRSNKEQQRLIGEELDGMRTLLPKGFVSINRVRAMERDAAALDGSYGAYRADIARSSEAIGEARMQVVALDRQMMEEVATQMRDGQIRLDELQPKLVALREQLARSTVRAPASGRVVGLKIFTVGGVVTPGETLMEIVPQDRMLVIEGKALPTDADDLAPGMTTQIRFTALQERNLPILVGKISKVSADSFEDERTGMRFFNIQLLVPPSELAKLRQVRRDGGLRAGLPVDIMIPLRKRTALAYLVEPLGQTLWMAGREN
ncbi:HlyD family type I secretion periplasmic adaptor subunit [Sphingopyxis macrogoltabida]|uniref:Membrane fusion protein (MFP) family protein n=1 Tax=Sphingopyxis macrogoltabida TaxID=33050 RepID=A0A0N9USQ7_SPHMC|nr:HlyD family type I secretion periplasmic adaptor subunit [Sphingopyxis macrogoltabida]ALH79663.1 secretion protein HylD [Sphingopyxis macrogoltabida]